MATIEIGGISYDIRRLNSNDINEVYGILLEVGIQPLKEDIVDIFGCYAGGCEGAFTEEGHLIGK